MSRTDIINRLIEKYGYESYLEIGVRSGANFKKVKCSKKVGVDIIPESAATVIMSSNEFFELNKEMFDLVFVDGDHEGEQVFLDVENALAVLNDGGMIVMHDCNPESEWLQRPASEFVVGEAWNGTVWKAFVKLRHRQDLRMAVVNTDEGIGLVQRGEQEPLDCGELSYQDFASRRKEVLCLMEVGEMEDWLDKREGMDVLLVRYFDNKRDEAFWLRTTRALERESVQIWDNNSKNIGLVKARKKLLEESNAKYVCLMDFDFTAFHLDFKVMCKKLKEEGVGMVVPWTPPARIDNSVEWEDKSYAQCSVMVMKRSVLESVGGLDDGFNTAYGDWDLIARLWKAGYRVVQHNRSFATHAPMPKSSVRSQTWKRDRDYYVKKHGSQMKRTEPPLKVVLADSNGTHFKWLENLHQYFIKRGFAVERVAGWNKKVGWWSKQLSGASMVFLWNGAHPIFQPAVKACKQAGISLRIVEVGWFPQKEYYFVDETGINCRSSIMTDDLEWVGERQYDKLEEVKERHLKGRQWKGGGKVLAPLQLEDDMNWVLDGGVGSMQDFINHVQDRFGKENVIFKKHPLDRKNYLVHNIEMKGNLLDMISEASLVYGVNSTSLLEAALMGAPVKSMGGGYLRGHESNMQRLLAALSDKQVPVSSKNVDYWFEDILAEMMEAKSGHSEAPWSALGNSAIFIIPCRNCGKFIGECLDSVRGQTWKDIGIVVIDDCSDDDTASVARKHLKGIDHRVIKNSFRRWALRNIDTAITGYCGNEDSVIFLLDGDDYLIDDQAVEKMMAKHERHDVVWSSYRTDVKGWIHKGKMIDGSVPPRRQLWEISPLRSFKKFLFDAIDREQFMDSDGQYFKVTWDQAIMFPIVEMAPHERRCFIDEVFYYYRMHGDNDHARGVAEQKRAEGVIRRKQPARLHDKYRQEITVVVSCYNQMYVLPIFLESMFYQTVLPTRVIVADDGSTDGVCDWVDQNAFRYPFELSYVTREHDGYRLASLNNLAAKRVSKGRLLFTNADVVHSPGSVEAHLNAEGVGGGIVRGVAVKSSGNVDVAMVRDFEQVEALHKKAPSTRQNEGYMAKTDPKHNPIGVWGGNFSMPVEKFIQVGGFDEGFKGWGGEDNELVRRISSLGCHVGWVKESAVYHLDHDNRVYAFQQKGSEYYLKKLVAR